MRHRAKGRQLSRTSSHKRAMLNNMATSLFAHGRVITTEARRTRCASRRRSIRSPGEPMRKAPMSTSVWGHRSRISNTNRARRRRAAHFIQRRMLERQVDCKTTPPPRSGFDRDPAAALADDSIDGRQPQPGSFARTFRGKEGLENMRFGFAIHPFAGIAHGEQDVKARA